ncbi:MAG: hypothetical protein AAFR11_01145 [Pseudomonadota bacterium]
MTRDRSIYDPVAVEIDGETVFMPRWMTRTVGRRRRDAEGPERRVFISRFDAPPPVGAKPQGVPAGPREPSTH